MLDPNFDPYEMLMQMQERIRNLEHVHNLLANAFTKSEAELTKTLKLLRDLQQHHLKLRLEHDQLKQTLRIP